MTTSTEAVAEEHPVEDTAPAPEPSTAEGLQGRLQELSDENTRLANQLKSRDVGMLRQKERDELQRLILDRVEANERTTRELIQTLLTSPEDESKRVEALDRIRTGSAQHTSELSARATYTKLFNNLQDAVLGEDGDPIFNLDDAPELEEFRREWLSAAGRSDFGTLTDLVGHVHKLVRTEERKKGQEALRKARTKPSQEQLDLDAGRGTGGAPSNPTSLGEAAQLFNEGHWTASQYSSWKRDNGY